MRYAHFPCKVLYNRLSFFNITNCRTLFGIISNLFFKYRLWTLFRGVSSYQPTFLHDCITFIFRGKQFKSSNLQTTLQ